MANEVKERGRVDESFPWEAVLRSLELFVNKLGRRIDNNGTAIVLLALKCLLVCGVSEAIVISFKAG